MLKGVGFKVRLPEFRSLLYGFPQLCLWASDFPSLSFSFLTGDMGIMMVVLASLGCGKN